MNEKAKNFIIKQLNKLPKEYGLEFKGDDAWLFCIEHDQENLHLSQKVAARINLSNDDYPLGSFYCYSCGYKSTFNEVASRFKSAGLRCLKSSELYDEDIALSEDMSSLGLANVKYKPIIKPQILPIDAIPWNPKEDWRTISGQLLSDICALKMLNKFMYLMIFLPVIMEGIVIGGIQGQLEKKKGIASYINTPGNWALKALFPYDYVLAKFKPLKVLILVEGPRDALNLIQHGLPALAVLGSSTKMSSNMLNLIVNLNLDLVILAFDGDAPGQAATKKAFKFFKDKVNVKKLSFAVDEDPGSMPTDRISNIKRKLKRYL